MGMELNGYFSLFPISTYLRSSKVGNIVDLKCLLTHVANSNVKCTRKWRCPCFFCLLLVFHTETLFRHKQKRVVHLKCTSKLLFKCVNFVYGNVLLWPVPVSTSLSHLCSTLLTIILTCDVMCHYILELFFNCCPNWHSLDVGF
jgi:hypothetical protein